MDLGILIAYCQAIALISNNAGVDINSFTIVNPQYVIQLIAGCEWHTQLICSILWAENYRVEKLSVLTISTRLSACIALSDHSSAPPIIHQIVFLNFHFP
jgi:hypothetical protein